MITVTPLKSYNQPKALNPPLKLIAATIFLAALALKAQQPPRIVVLLDPAHGGPDAGAHLSGTLLEKDLTLSLNSRLRAALAPNNFGLISTRDSDPTVPFLTDQRAEIANRTHPAACLTLHATSSGRGIHIVTSALPAPREAADLPSPHAPIPWDAAQSASIPQSLRLANELGVALLHARIPVLLTQGSIPPLDNLNCPAVAIEIAPLSFSKPASINDAAYQQRIVQAIAAGLSSWRAHNPPVVPGASPNTATGAAH